MVKLNFVVPSRSHTTLDVARSYIAAGVPIFPCHEIETDEMDPGTGEFIIKPEKSPYTSNGLKGATRSSRIVDIWFGDRHPNALIGVPTGEGLGGWVLDLDRHGELDGHEWLASMEAQHGPLPETARARTANGGTHVFFKHVDGIRNRAAIAPGVDTRGESGYICGPGSVMADGRRYEWIDREGNTYEPDGIPEFADTPAWLLELLLPKPAAPRAEYTYTARDVEPYVNAAVESEMSKLASAPVGNRGSQLNASAFSLGQLVAAGALSRAAAEDDLYRGAAANGVLQKDGEKETNRKIKRGLDAGAKSPREIPERTGANDNTPAVSVEGMIEKARAKKEGLQKAEFVKPDATKTADVKPDTLIRDSISSEPNDIESHITTPKKRERFERIWFDDIVEGEPKETFIKGVLGSREFTTVSGLPGTGKSVIVTDMACHVAAGREWHGKKVKQGLVIYVAAERKKLTERRMMAFRLHHKISDVPLLIIGGRLDFTKDLKDARELIAEIKNAELETGQTCIWIIIDTLTRVFGAGDQNASKDMGRFVQSCDEILMETTAHVTAIHHSAWSGERGKGAIDLDGAVDASFMVKKDHGKYRLVCDGTNDGEEGDVLAFTMLSVEVGRDEDQEPTNAPVVQAVDEEAVGKMAGKMVEAIRGHNARAFEILKELVATVGGTPDSPHFPADAIVVREEAWRQAVYDDDKAAKQGTLQTRYKRANAFLKDSSQVEQIGEWVFVK